MKIFPEIGSRVSLKKDLPIMIWQPKEGQDSCMVLPKGLSGRIMKNVSNKVELDFCTIRFDGIDEGPLSIYLKNLIPEYVREWEDRLKKSRCPQKKVL